MSDQENTGGETKDRMSPVVVVESVSSKQTLPYKITDLQDVGAPDLHQKCASSEKLKPIAKKLSSSLTSKRRGSPLPTAIPMTPLDSQGKTAETTLAPPALPIPIPVRPGSGVDKDKEETEVQDDDDSITSEIAELRTPPGANESSDWSDEEEAGGLPRSESRSSRVIRAARQLLCCGVRLEAPSEDNMPSPRSGFFNSGI